MAKVKGDIVVRVGADVSPLQKGMRGAGRELDNFAERSRKMARNVAKAGAAVTAALGVGAVGAYALVKSAAEAGAEIERLSRIAGATPEKFQRMAYAARTVGVEQDKLADILKDVQDKVGDFLETGGGPMADFFENIAPKVGVTADNFKELSGPDALQLYVSSLQKAKLSQSQMTFYMEALASDATALLPLLNEGGKEFDRLGEEAAKAGGIMSNEAVNGSSELRRELDALTGNLRTQLNEAILENKEEIIAVADQITKVWIPALLGIAQAFTKIIEGVQEATRLYRVWKGVESGGSATAGLTPEEREREMKKARDLGGGDPSNTGLYGTDADGNIITYGTGDDGLDGSAGNDRLASRLDAYLADVSTFHENRLNLLQGYSDREIAIASATAEELNRIDQLARDQKLDMAAGAFGDLASLMQSENEKLFKIGKAAAIAEATVSGYQAAVDAWAHGMKIGGPPVAAAFTAASLARTGALISSIASTSANGGGGGAGGGAAAAVASAPAPLEVRLSGLGADDRLTGADVGALLDRLSEEAGDRGYRIMVAR